ncbi:unnamed protein product [Effrenium voratum]|nr:unnamed protein product [Effrenium voratum]
MPADADAAKAVDPEVEERWGKDLRAIEESIRLMLSNHLQEAEDLLAEATADVAKREFRFDAGDHDMRGCFSFVNALMSLINGLASLENNQLDIVLERVRLADDQLTADSDWPGRTVLRGLCNLVAGVVEIMQGMPSRGVWHVLRSWFWLRTLESEALTFDGHERGCVRSTALLALGVFNLFVSMLPPTAMKAAGWATGFSGGRDVALSQLRACWEEGGIQAPFAGMVLIGFCVDVSSFLGELRQERAARHDMAKEILDWGRKDYPGAFFFAGLEAGYLAAERDLEGGLRGRLRLLPSQPDAVKVYQGVGRRALCPSLSLNSHLCYSRAGCKERAAEMLDTCLAYQKEKKKWSPLDKVSLRQAEAARRHAQDPAGDANGRGHPEIESEVPTPMEEKWQPVLLLYLKICLVYRGVNFMKPQAAKEFLQMVQEETDSQLDPDSRCMGLCIQAEAMRQGEHWDEALQLASEGCALQPKLSPQGLKTGVLHFCHLVVAYAHYAQGRPGLAQEALTKLSSLGLSDHFFQKQVEFKATHLRRLVGAEFEESYRDISVPARGQVRLVVELPEGTSAQWDFILSGYSIDFAANFVPSSGEPEELQRAEQYQAEAGPFEGGAGPFRSAGQVELVFSNTFSMLRGKSLQCRVLPNNLEVRQED